MSSISTFNDGIKKVATDVEVATNYIEGSGVMNDNPYKRAVYIYNSGKTSKTNYMVPIKIDTASIYNANQCAWTFSDLRVYDSNGTTELEFAVEAPNTTYTVVWVKIPSLPASTKTIYFTYGNPSLKSRAKSLSYFYPVLGSSKLVNWHKATVGGDQFFRTPYSRWDNEATRYNFIRNQNQNAWVFHQTNRVNGLPAVQFNGNTTWLHSNTTVIPANASYDVILVEGKNSSKSVNYAITDNGAKAANEKLHIGYASDTTFRFGQYLNDLDYSSSILAYSGSVVYRQWSCYANGSGHFIRLNGSLVRSNSNTTRMATENKIEIGRFDDSNYYSGFIPEVLIFTGGLSTSERTEVEGYLNRKYRLYSSTDFPTTGLGSQTANTGHEFSYISYYPVVTEYETESSLESDYKIAGAAQQTGKTNLTNTFFKTLAVGNGVESWTASTLDSTSKLHGRESRRITATTTVSSDEVTIQQMNGTTNLADLSKFNLDNIVSTTTYTSTDEDYIELDFYCSNHVTIDLNNSFIRLSNSAGNSYYQASFAANINSLASNKLVTIKIKKSSFAATGSPTWSSASIKARVGVRTTTGSQTVYYNWLRMRMNPERAESRFGYKYPVKISNHASDDNGSSWYKQTVLEGRLQANYPTTDDFEFEVGDYLGDVLNRSLSEFDSFPSNYVHLRTPYSLGTGGIEEYYTFAVRKLLGFIFPDSFLDVDLDVLVDTDIKYNDGSVNTYFVGNANIIVFNAHQKVGDILNALLSNVAGICTYDQSVNKIVCRHGHTIWDDTTYLSEAFGLVAPGKRLQTPVEVNHIYEFDSVYSDTDYIFNHIELINYINPSSPTIMGLIVAQSDLQFELRGNGVTTVFFDEENFWGKKELTRIFLLSGFYVEGFQVATEPTSNAFDTTGITVTDVGSFGGKVYVKFNNANFALKYLRQIVIRGDIEVYSAYNPQNGVNDFVVQNTDSINKYGKKTYEVENIYSWVPQRYGTNQIKTTARIYRAIIDKYKDPKNVYEFSCQYNPSLAVGRVVRFTDQLGKYVTAHILELEHQGERAEITQRVKCREV